MGDWEMPEQEAAVAVTICIRQRVPCRQNRGSAWLAS